VSTTAPEDVRARAVMILAAGGAGPTALEGSVRDVAPRMRAAIGSGGSLRAGVRHADDPLGAAMGDRGALEPVDAVIEMTAASDASPADVVALAGALAGELGDAVDLERSAVVAGWVHRFLSEDGALFVALAGFRDPSISMDELSRWWLEEHGPLALRIVQPSPRAYEQLHADHDASRAASEAAGVPYGGYDMYDTIAVDSMDDLMTAMMNPEVATALFEDELGHVDHARLRGAVQRTLV